jgi:hypothetical protein
MRIHHGCRVLIGVLLAVALAACQDPAPETPGRSSPDAGGDAPGSGGDETMGGNDMSEADETPNRLEQAIEAAQQDLAAREAVDPADIEVLEAREVTWRNGALGCPEEGMMYTQALVKGLFVKLGAGERSFAYHAGSDGQPFLCPAERSQVPPPLDEDG